MWWVVRDALFHQQVPWGPCSQRPDNSFSGKHHSNSIPVVLSLLSDFRWMDHPQGDCVLTFFRSPSCLRVFQAFTVLVLPSFLLLSSFLNFHLLCLCHDVGYLGTWVLQPRDPPHVLEWNCLGVPCPFQSLCCLPALGSVQVAEGSGHLLLRLSFPVANMWNISLNFSSLVYI